MRSVSAMAALVTPRSAALALSGRTMSSGRTRLDELVTAPMPGMPRSSFSTTAACCCSAWPSAPASTSTYFSALAPKPTFTRAPGRSASSVRSSASMSCLLVFAPKKGLRSRRCVRFSVSVARVTSGRPAPGVKVSAPVLPPPMAVYTSFTCGLFCTSSRACSAAAKVCA